MKEYYYCDETNAVHGPMSAARMKALRLSGILRDDTKVCLGGSQDWRPYSEVLPDDPLPQVTPRPETLQKEARNRRMRAYWGDCRKQWSTSLPGMQLLLLILIAVLLAVNLFRTQPVEVTVPQQEENNPVQKSPAQPIPVSIVMGDSTQYQYGALHLSREDMQYALTSAKKADRLSHGVCPLSFQMAEIAGWEYMGIICNDGINASWILMRRTKESAKEEEARNARMKQF